MKVRSKDVPQAPRLGRIRDVIDAVAKGARDLHDVAKAAGGRDRDARYYLSAASRTLGLLEARDDGYQLTGLGRGLAATARGSDAERRLLATAIRQSAVVRLLAGDLLGPERPRLERVRRRIERTGLAESTAEQRARGLLSWRDQLEPNQAMLEYVDRVAPVVGVREVVATDRVGDRSPVLARPMLASIRFEDFKSFANETVTLAPLTVFVGANASGKSNALDAIRFLQGVALELPISDVLRGRYEGGREVWPAIRGGISEACRSGRDEFELETSWALEGRLLTHRLRCGTKPVPLVHRECLAGEEMGLYLFDTHAKTLGAGAGLTDGRAIGVALKGNGGKNPTQRHSAAASLMGQIQPGERVKEVVSHWTAKVQAAMRSATFLSISPAAMRDYAPAQALEMGANGSNISAIVKQLCERPEAKQRLVDWLSELCAPKVRDIDFVDTELGDVMLLLVEEDGSRVSARSLSDGTLRFLGELVALLTAKPGSILLIEEIENGLHPQRLHLLVELLEGVTRERGIQVIVTTHSPLVLMALSKPSLESAVVFARVAGREGTLTRRLGDLPHFSQVAERRGVDQLFASGWLERAL